MTELTNEGRAGNDADGNTETENHSCDDVHAHYKKREINVRMMIPKTLYLEPKMSLRFLLTMLRETLDDGSDGHDSGADEDRPPSAIPVVDDGHEGERQNSTERVRGSNDALQLGTLVSIFISEVWTSKSASRTLV